MHCANTSISLTTNDIIRWFNPMKNVYRIAFVRPLALAQPNNGSNKVSYYRNVGFSPLLISSITLWVFLYSQMIQTLDFKWRTGFLNLAIIRLYMILLPQLNIFAHFNWYHLVP